VHEEMPVWPNEVVAGPAGSEATWALSLALGVLAVEIVVAWG